MPGPTWSRVSCGGASATASTGGDGIEPASSCCRGGAATGDEARRPAASQLRRAARTRARSTGGCTGSLDRPAPSSLVGESPLYGDGGGTGPASWSAAPPSRPKDLRRAPQQTVAKCDAACGGHAAEHRRYDGPIGRRRPACWRPRSRPGIGHHGGHGPKHGVQSDDSFRYCRPVRRGPKAGARPLFLSPQGGKTRP